MAQLVKKRRPGWVLLVVSALVASLFAVPAAAIDDDSNPNAEAATSACVGDATGDMMFSDVSEGHAFRAAINCLAYYGVTIGYGDGTFGPNNDVSNEEMILFMERAAGIAGADAEAVVGDFAMSGSDPVDRGDMALLIARLLVSATTAESPVNVENNDDGTFTIKSVGTDNWDYFADARSSLNRVKDSAVSALYELGVAKGTGMGYFSPASTVSRGAMAAFITRALAHTTARPEGVTIQTDEPGGVIISVRDSNFAPVANAPVDVFSARADQVDEAFKDDGSCNTARVNPEANTDVCEIGALDAITGLDGNYDPGVITVNVDAGGTTVWAWTGDRGDEVEDGGEGIAYVELTETAPASATNAKVTTDMAMGANRAHFGSTVTVTIQLVDADGGDAGPPEDGASYRVVVRSLADATLNTALDDLAEPVDLTTEGSSVSTNTLHVDASGKATFTVTAVDPDPNDDDDPENESVDRVRVTYTVTQLSGPFATPGDNTSGQATVADGTDTVMFSDGPSVPRGAAVNTSADYLMAPTNGGSASNVVTVTITDQYGKPMRNQMVRLDSSYEPTGDRTSDFPVARRTDSSGSVRIGYAYTGAASVETVVAHVADDDATLGADNRVPPNTTNGGQASVYWVSALTAATLDSGAALVADTEANTLIIANAANGPQLVRYDDNDQFTITRTVDGSPVETNSTMAAFEEALAADADDNDDTVIVTSYDSTDPSTVARFALTVVTS